MYVLEFLLGQYCSSDDETVIEKGVQNVKRILADNFVRPDESQKILSQLRKKGSHTIIDMVTVRLDMKKDCFFAEFSNLGVGNVPIADEYPEKFDRLLCGGIWCIVQLDYVGKSVVSGVTASAAKVTVTVDGKTYTATADDVTGAFTVATSALKGTSTIKVDATRNGVNGTYSYAMKNGNIESGFVPTSPTLPTQPTTSTQPTTATQPTAPTQPTTATEPTTAPAQKLTVNATSNYFGSASKTVSTDGKKVTVLYKLNSNMGVVDGQWAVKYDSSKLKFNMADNKADGKQTIMPSQSNLIHNAYSNVIKVAYFTSPHCTLLDHT